MNYKRFSITLILCLTGLLFAVEPCCAQGAEKAEQIHQFMASKISGDVPGVSVLVVHGDRRIFNKGYGFAHVQQQIPNSPQTVFRLGSVTKQFTAMAIMLLHEKELLQFDQTIDAFFPDAKGAGSITVRQLLTHTSGITESLESEPEFTPGSRMNYSNTGYKLLGEIIETVSGQTYHDFLNTFVFQPLAMHATGFEHAGAKIQHMAGGYYLQNGTYLPRQSTDISDAYAAGALYSTTEDLFKWNEALSSEILVSKNTLEQAFTGATLNNGNTSAYGFGWMLNQWNGLKEVSHGGDITGFNSYISRFPEQQFAVIVLSNFEMNPPGPIPNARQLAHEITNICLSETIQTTAAKKSIQVKPAILRSYEGTYRLKDAPPEIVNVMGDSLTVLVKENKIFIAGKLGEVELMPEEVNKFFLQDKTTIEFLSENNTVKGFKMDLMGMGVRILMAEKY